MRDWLRTRCMVLGIQILFFLFQRLISSGLLAVVVVVVGKVLDLSNREAKIR